MKLFKSTVIWTDRENKVVRTEYVATVDVNAQAAGSRAHNTYFEPTETTRHCIKETGTNEVNCGSLDPLAVLNVLSEFGIKVLPPLDTSFP